MHTKGDNMSFTFKKKLSTAANDATSAAPSSSSTLRLPPGTRLNTNGNLLLISSGIQSLDSFIGGGFPVGSLILIYEDDDSSYLSDSILRCFLSDGVYSKHDLCISSMRTDPTQFIKNLPTKSEKDQEQEDGQSDDSSMKIAWRYENLSSSTPSLKAQQHSHYDLNSKNSILPELLDQISITKFTWTDYEQKQQRSKQKWSTSYRDFLFQSIDNLILSNYSTTNVKEDKRILRLCIQSLSSCLFDTDQERFAQIYSFLYCLRISLRQSLATCIVTLSSKYFYKQLENLCDIIFEMKLPSQLISGDYVGFCNIIKLPKLNSITSFIPDTWDIGIKLIKHKKYLLFEKYSIPPDLASDASRDGSNEKKSSSLMNNSSSACSTHLQANKLDF
ncbi:unnamed protein product [Didymodactylos carnosus]|uniref:Elongator complex protein 4 n=1 Tax=Didymodactylos carnosus TaxID=1234261 RepID=A0A8S2GFC9_9BILA|nr:unnamed protein product [Didymodactylos carnosus]CAF3510219.1 unnamed protein product [Didymodactylos carnosus]